MAPGGKREEERAAVVADVFRFELAAAERVVACNPGARIPKVEVFDHRGVSRVPVPSSAVPSTAVPSTVAAASE